MTELFGRDEARRALEEDRARDDVTTALLGAVADRPAEAAVRAEERCVVAGVPVAAEVFALLDPAAALEARIAEGAWAERGARIATVRAPGRVLLAGERTALNFLQRLSGIATATARAVAAAGRTVAVLDTRKTTPGLRLLEKSAVTAGGGRAHRGGLDDGILIKDNHLAACGPSGGKTLSPAEAVRRVRAFLEANLSEDRRRGMMVEVEVDTIEQLAEVLPEGPDVVLLDNMRPDQLREAVARRNAKAPRVQLEASGGVTLETVGEVAATGVERISVGALTHSAPALDCGIDWRP